MIDNTTNNKVELDSFESLVTINDIRDLDYSNQDLSTQQRLALKNFDRYRISELNRQFSEDDFHKKYMQLQVMANLTPYNEFLKEGYYL
jgi:hypothetical protein